jgi:hypothetical protein
MDNKGKLTETYNGSLPKDEKDLRKLILEGTIKLEEDDIGQTMAMEMIETLNKEHDQVLSENVRLKEGHDLIYKSLRSAEGTKELMTGSEPECIAESVGHYIQKFHEQEDEIKKLKEELDEREDWIDPDSDGELLWDVAQDSYLWDDYVRESSVYEELRSNKVEEIEGLKEDIRHMYDQEDMDVAQGEITRLKKVLEGEITRLKKVLERCSSRKDC